MLALHTIIAIILVITSIIIIILAISITIAPMTRTCCGTTWTGRPARPLTPSGTAGGSESCCRCTTSGSGCSPSTCSASVRARSASSSPNPSPGTSTPRRAGTATGRCTRGSGTTRPFSSSKHSSRERGNFSGRQGFHHHRHRHVAIVIAIPIVFRILVLTVLPPSRSSSSAKQGTWHLTQPISGALQEQQEEERPEDRNSEHRINRILR